MNPDAPKPVFREVQTFRQLWIWLLILPVSGIAWYSFILQVVLDKPWEDRTAPDWVMVLAWLASGVGLPLLILGLRLITEVRQDGIYIQFFPLHLRFHHWAFTDMDHCEARTYRPIVEYGGWGIRYGFSGKAYNVSGCRGVQLRFKNGKRLLIGSQRADELAASIQRGMA